MASENSRGVTHENFQTSKQTKMTSTKDQIKLIKNQLKVMSISINFTIHKGNNSLRLFPRTVRRRRK